MKKEVEASNQTITDDFLSTLAEKVGAIAKASIVFGEAVERDGVTVIPVAKARWGFGGGAGNKDNDRGSGGGGGAVVTPIGFIEIREGQAVFKRIYTIPPSLFALGGMAVFFLVRDLLRRR